MSTNRMLIDAAHPEETRVAVLNENRLHDFDVESVARKQIKSNIYLAKVIRVEPSLQAAFVDYGGNRHGFLSFSEIHPDYYQIPIEDREALLAEHQAAELAEEATEEAALEKFNDKNLEITDENAQTTVTDTSYDESKEQSASDEDNEEARPMRRPTSHNRYKVQEVIKRRQILLIQVVKEERGNKGAALTTYISLAGRYCVLMPNTARGGGISRKITNGVDRKRLKAILSELKLPEGIAVIVRTAGSKRSKAEIKRDYEYLLRLWDSVRKLTLESSAPTLVHEEGNLIKRSIRDLYARDIEEIIVAGERGYRMAKDFIKLLVPSHAKRVQPYTETKESIFQHYQVETQLDALHSPQVQMKSGAYIVINPTEALVSIDVNSGRSTRERNIEETAFKTNLEAADEIARQLRLRDQAGLIVIDFIDMEQSRNNSLVEKRLKEATRHDRARIQIGSISPFGLLEMSRQRLRMSLIETSSESCPYCEGTGVRRSTDSSALVALRAVQEEANQKELSSLVVHAPTAVALYILNQKRQAIADIEKNTETSIIITADESLIPPALKIERIDASGKIELVTQLSSTEINDVEDKTPKRKRRSRRRISSDVDTEKIESQASRNESHQNQTSKENSNEEESSEEMSPKRRRRGKRGGRRRRGRSEDTSLNEENSTPNLIGEKVKKESKDIILESPTKLPTVDEDGEIDSSPTNKPKRRRRTRKPNTKEPSHVTNEENQAVEEPTSSYAKNEKVTEISKTKSKVATEAQKTTVINIGDKNEQYIEKPKKGWWQSG